MGARSHRNAAQASASTAQRSHSSKAIRFAGAGAGFVRAAPFFAGDAVGSRYCSRHLGWGVGGVSGACLLASRQRDADFIIDCGSLGVLWPSGAAGAGAGGCSAVFVVENSALSGFYGEASNRVGANRTRHLRTVDKAAALALVATAYSWMISNSGMRPFVKQKPAWI